MFVGQRWQFEALGPAVMVCVRSCAQAIGTKLAKADVSDTTENALVAHRFGCVRTSTSASGRLPSAGP